MMEDAAVTNAQIEATRNKVGTPVAAPTSYVLRGDGVIVQKKDDRVTPYAGEHYRIYPDGSRPKAT